jgi:phosphopentomutase
VRALLIVLDSAGVGNAPDAAEYGDEGANTLGHIFERQPDLHLPNLADLGLHAVLAGNSAVRSRYRSSFGRMAGTISRQGHDDGPLGNRGSDFRKTGSPLSKRFHANSSRQLKWKRGLNSSEFMRVVERSCWSSLAATLAEFFQLKRCHIGRSFLDRHS